MRAFFALDLPEAEKARLGAWQRHQARPWRWTRSEGLHLTLAFLGEIAPGPAVSASRIGATVAARHRPFTLKSDEVGAFPNSVRARVLWLGLDPSPELDALAMDLRAALHGAGLLFDDKPFKAHLTLARLDPAGTVAGLPAPTPFDWNAGELVLMESLGGRYLSKERWAFA